MTRYNFEVDLPSDVPADVVAEYVGAALKRYVTDRVNVKVVASGGTLHGPVVGLPRVSEKADFTERQLRALRQITEPVRVARQHPFEGPEVFDDDITADTFTVQDAHPIQGDYPHLTGLLASRRDAATIADGEGDWQLTNDDNAGDDTL